MRVLGTLPGMAADVVDENGKSVRGQVANCDREPWIGMTRVWKDPQRYVETYCHVFRMCGCTAIGPQSMRMDCGTSWALRRHNQIAGKRSAGGVESVLVAHRK